MQTVFKNALFFSLYFIITIGQASAQDQPQDELRLRALAQAIMAESAGLVPRTIETEIKIFDRSGRQIGSEIGTITLTRLSDGSLRSGYVSKTIPRSRPQAGASQGSPGKAPSGGFGGGRPPAGPPPAGGSPRGGGPGGGAPGEAGGGRGEPGKRSKANEELIAHCTDGNRLLELARLANPFLVAEQAQVSFEAAAGATADGEVRLLPFIVRQDRLRVKGEVTVTADEGVPTRCSAEVQSKDGKRRRMTIWIRYFLDSDSRELRPAEIDIKETIRKGLFGLRSQSAFCIYKPGDFFPAP